MARGEKEMQEGGEEEEEKDYEKKKEQVLKMEDEGVRGIEGKGDGDEAGSEEERR